MQRQEFCRETCAELRDGAGQLYLNISFAAQNIRELAISLNLHVLTFRRAFDRCALFVNSRSQVSQT